MIITEETLGSDFEMAVFDKTEKRIVPVTKFLGGTKDNPEPIGEDCFKQEDGPMAEFNIKPIENMKDWVYYFNYCQEKGNEFLNSSNKELKAISSHVYTNEDLDNNELRELGCSESHCAYTHGINKPNGEITNLRTTGVHIQVGFKFRCPVTEETFRMKDAENLSKYFDTYIGIPSVILDKDTERRKLYGKAGDFRKGSKWCDVLDRRINLYEYRSLGGGLLKYKKNVKWLYQQTRKVIKEYNSQTRIPDDRTLINTINNSNRKEAKKLITQLKIKMP